jgi:hypothetical protein
LVKTACRLFDLYTRLGSPSARRHTEDLKNALDSSAASAIREATLLDLAAAKGWKHAAHSQLETYRYTLDGLISTLRSRCPDTKAKTPGPSARDLALELASIRDEFDGFDIDLRTSKVSAVVGPIRLQGRDLGQFRIELDWNQSADSDPLEWYSVEALDPNTPSSSDHITHPHVDDDRLCTGDATSPITNALNDGRLHDFFCLVRSVLETYNPASAYVKLEDWDGVRCHDCGYSAHPDNIYFCSRCECDYCEECIRSCSECSEGGCRECLQTSEISNAWVCEACSAKCDHCDKLASVSELEDGRCASCIEQAAEPFATPSEAAPSPV